MAEEVLKKVAKIYAGKDWHKLSANEKEVVKILEEGGYILPNSPADGFVGKAI